jgi:hypothetical protein
MHAAFAMLRLVARAAHYKELQLRLIQLVGSYRSNEPPTSVLRLMAFTFQPLNEPQHTGPIN